MEDASHTAPAPPPGSAFHDASSAAVVPIPDRIGRYQIIREIGRGGMGVVFAAQDPVLNVPLALKVLPRLYVDDGPSRTRLLREARNAALMRGHPNVVTIYEANTDGPIPYVAMELVQGEPLNEWIARGNAIPIPQAVRIAQQIAAGLAEAHQGGLVHRDIKPHNIMMTARSGIKILDFGVAKRLAPDVTRTGTIVGASGGRRWPSVQPQCRRLCAWGDSL